MISNTQKKEFIETIYGKFLEDQNSEEMQRELMRLMMEDTNNGKMYKYRSFNEYSLANLEKGTMYCAMPSLFNDPFDCRMGIDIDSYIADAFKDEEEKKRKLAKKFAPMFSKIDAKLSEIIDKEFRVGCVCTDHKNRLMWSHYADGHKGFCIEYDFGKDDTLLKELLMMPVVYSKERIKIPWNLAIAGDKQDENLKQEATKAMKLSLLIKDDVWSYENEWRIIVSGSSGIESVKMPPVSCIYIGALCGEKNKAVLMKMAEELEIPVKQMTVDRGEYTLHAQKVDG